MGGTGAGSVPAKKMQAPRLEDLPLGLHCSTIDLLGQAPLRPGERVADGAVLALLSLVLPGQTQPPFRPG